jgi:hypothetical protein
MKANPASTLLNTDPTERIKAPRAHLLRVSVKVVLITQHL